MALTWTWYLQISWAPLLHLEKRSVRCSLLWSISATLRTSQVVWCETKGCPAFSSWPFSVINHSLIHRPPFSPFRLFEPSGWRMFANVCLSLHGLILSKKPSERSSDWHSCFLPLPPYLIPTDSFVPAEFRLTPRCLLSRICNVCRRVPFSAKTSYDGRNRCLISRGTMTMTAAQTSVCGCVCVGVCHPPLTRERTCSTPRS